MILMNAQHETIFSLSSNDEREREKKSHMFFRHWTVLIKEMIV